MWAANKTPQIGGLDHARARGKVKVSSVASLLGLQIASFVFEWLFLHFNVFNVSSFSQDISDTG